MVTADGVSQRKAIDRVYAQIASGSAAQTFVSEYYRGDPPFKRAETDRCWKGLVGFRRLNHSCLTLDATANFSHQWCECFIFRSGFKLNRLGKLPITSGTQIGSDAVLSAISSSGSARSEAFQP